MKGKRTTGRPRLDRGDGRLDIGYARDERPPLTLRAKLLIVCGVALLGGLGYAVATTTDWEAVLAGEGYVPWLAPRWNAVQTAYKAERPLVVCRVDPRHPSATHLEEVLLPSDEVRAWLPGFVWHREEVASGGNPPQPAEVVVYAWENDGRILAQEEIGALSPAALGALLRQAHEDDPGDRSSATPGHSSSFQSWCSLW